jgi:hypothetical protein
VTDKIDIWERLERSVAARPTPTASVPAVKDAEAEEDDEQAKKRRRRLLQALDIVSAVFWVYTLTKVFVLDVDRKVVELVAPGAEGLLDYRFFFYLAIFVLLLWRGRKFLLILGYIVVWPIILFVWKIPAFFVRRKSWTLFLGSLQAVVTALSDFRYNVTTKAAALVAVTVILATAWRPALTIAALYIGWLFALSYVRLLRKTFSGSSFFSLQRQKIASILESRPVRFLTSMGEEYKRANIQVYDQNQFNQLTTSISMGVLINKGLYYWAYQLERYRREYSPSTIFSAVSYLWLFFGALASFAVMNEALLKLEPSQLTTNGDPSFLAVTMYALATLFVQEGGGISAAGDWAYALQLAAGIAGPILLATFLLNFLVTYKRERDESALRDLVARLKEVAREQDARFREDWSVGVDEAYKRLEQLGEGLGFLVRLLTSAVPADFFDDDQPRKPS